MMFSDKSGGPAFPFTPVPGMSGIQGMSLRDWFAGQAMKALMSSPQWVSGMDEHAAKRGTKFKEQLAAEAYLMADHMIAERKNDL